MTSQNLPKITSSSLSAVPAQPATNPVATNQAATNQAVTKESERAGTPAEPTNFEELEEFKPDTEGRAQGKADRTFGFLASR